MGCITKMELCAELGIGTISLQKAYNSRHYQDLQELIDNSDVVFTKKGKNNAYYCPTERAKFDEKINKITEIIGKKQGKGVVAETDIIKELGISEYFFGLLWRGPLSEAIKKGEIIEIKRGYRVSNAGFGISKSLRKNKKEKTKECKELLFEFLGNNPNSTTAEIAENFKIRAQLFTRESSPWCIALRFYGISLGKIVREKIDGKFCYRLAQKKQS